MAIIKRGYRITCDTWENDGDSPNSVTKDGYSEVQCRFLCEVLSLFSADKFGNICDGETDLIEGLSNNLVSICKKYPGIFKTFNHEVYEDDETDLIEGTMDLVYDFGTARGDYYTRVVEKITVEYLPVDVIIEDVTERFL